MSKSALDTPMMRQYLGIKQQHPDAIVFYRMGDFYEMFLRDAELAAPLLDIALTTRDRGKPDAVPMCGIPVHAADQHVRRLAELGHRVAICEQVEDPKKTRKLVRREVVEVVTPGLVGDPEGLDARSEVTIIALLPAAAEGSAGLAALDVSTGDLRATQAPAQLGETLPPSLWEELERIGPREVLVPEAQAESLVPQLTARMTTLAVTPVAATSFDPTRLEGRIDVLASAQGEDAGVRAAAGLLDYLADNQPFALKHTRRLRCYELSDAMVLDAATRRHLELFENSEDRGRHGTLIDTLDQTVTPLGARRLARWVAYPLLSPERVNARQDAVTYLADRDRLRSRLRDALAPVRDAERLLAKAARPTATPRDLAALRASLAALPGVVRVFESEPNGDGLAQLDAFPGELPIPEALPEVVQLLEESLVESPPAVPRGSRGANETGYIREGFRPELDELRNSARKGRDTIAGLEARERERTGISNLRMRFHPVHGYSIEVTKSNLARVPEEYERKQTLANAERFTLPELREAERAVLGAHERAAELEREIFEAVRLETLEHAAAIGRAADAVATLDASACLADVARQRSWVRPSVDASDRLEIRNGRHPVIEPLLVAQGGEGYVPNDSQLDSEGVRILVLTGPNMSGKSTYLRQVALIVLLAQLGSYVPAEQARVGIVDRVFTRVGASDRLARGESTFMVEMRETAEILAQASSRSLVILDEIGRGTSTFDGLSIAWAVAEYLHDTPGLCPRTLFATHYHELIDLAQTKALVGNAHFEVREWQDEVIFLRRLAEGGANRSYGIQVAQLAGLPDSVIGRARQILANLESGEFDAQGRPRLAAAEPSEPVEGQLGLFQSGGPTAMEREVLEELRRNDPNLTAPMDALALLHRLVERLREDEA